jgi:hypothetical protein
VDELHAIALEALRAVIEDDDEYRTRRILRWYSREFHTPLHVVEDLPLDDVWQAFFEVQFEQMSEKKRLIRAAELTETPEERAARQREAHEADNQDEDFMAAFAKKAAEEAKSKAKKLSAPAEKKTALKAQPAMQAPTADAPDIEMVFEDEGNLRTKET